MNAERYVVLGAARPRAPWFADVGRWADSVAMLCCGWTLISEENRAWLSFVGVDGTVSWPVNRQFCDDGMVRSV